jgi:hypothetical protein
MITETHTVVEGLYTGTKVTRSPGFSRPLLKTKNSVNLTLIAYFGRTVGAAKTSADMVVRIKNTDTNVNLTMLEEMSNVEGEDQDAADA